MTSNRQEFSLSEISFKARCRSALRAVFIDNFTVHWATHLTAMLLHLQKSVTDQINYCEFVGEACNILVAKITWLEIQKSHHTSSGLDCLGYFVLFDGKSFSFDSPHTTRELRSGQATDNHNTMNFPAALNQII